MSTDRAMEKAIATVKMEGYHIDDKCVNQCRKLLDNKIDMNQYIAFVKKRAESIAK